MLKGIQAEHRIAQYGFTMIELVATLMVVSIIGVIVTAQFIDLRITAANAIAAELGNDIAAASSQNYVRGLATGTATIVASGSACATAASLVTLPTGFLVTQVAAPTGSGEVGQCTILNQNLTGTTAKDFYVVGCSTAVCG